MPTAPLDARNLDSVLIINLPFESPQVLRVHAPGVLHLDGPEAGRAIDHEIHLGARSGTPIVQGGIGPAVGEPGPQVLDDEAFQGGAPDLFRAIQGAAGP